MHTKSKKNTRIVHKKILNSMIAWMNSCIKCFLLVIVWQLCIEQLLFKN